MMEIIFILVIIGAVLVYAFRLLYKNQTRENYIFFSVVLLFFLVVYCVSVLQYRITGSTVGIEQTIQKINTTAAKVTRERQKIEKLEATIQGLAAKVTMLSVVGSADAKKDWSKSASQYGGQLKMYQNQVVEQLPLNLRQEVNEVRVKFESKDGESLHEE